MELIEKLNEFYDKDKLNSSEKKEFWLLVSSIKIKYEHVPKELAEIFGKIKSKITPWKLYSVQSGILLGIITLLLGIIAWIWWFSYYIITRSTSLNVFDIEYWTGFTLWIVFIFLIMEGPHELSHLFVAYLCKIKFNGWGIYKFQPTWDIEYSSYMQSSFNKRALTHLIGTPINLFQYLLHLIITTIFNIYFWLLWIPFLFIYAWLIWKGVKEGYGDLPRFYKELKRKKLHKKVV
ncbi:MAG: hypothetical protein ACFFHD_07340 [Promethearchaeota archaeon]